MTRKETRANPNELPRFKISKPALNYLNSLRHEQSISPSLILREYAKPQSALKKLMDRVKSPEQLFVLNAVNVMLARDSVIRESQPDDSQMKNVIPINIQLNRIYACNQAMSQPGIVELDAKRQEELLKEVLNFNDISDEAIASFIKRIRSIYGVDTPPKSQQRLLNDQVNRFLSSLKAHVSEVADIPTELASAIDPVTYGLQTPANRINEIDQAHGYSIGGTGHTLVGGDRHYLNSALGVNRSYFGLMERYLAPSMDERVLKLINQEALPTLQSCEQMLQWVRGIRFDDTIWNETNDSLWHKKRINNLVYDELTRKASGKSYGAAEFQKDWKKFVNDLGVTDRQGVLSFVNLGAGVHKPEWIEFVSMKVDKNIIYGMASDFLLTSDQIRTMVDFIDQVRIREQRPLEVYDYQAALRATVFYDSFVSMRNPWVPENFFQLYQTFREQLYQRGSFKDTKLTEGERTEILVLEEIIKERGYIHMFDDKYVEDMKTLSNAEPLTTAEIESTIRRLPAEIEEAKAAENAASQNMIEFNKRSSERDAMMIRYMVKSDMRMRKIWLEQRDNEKDIRSGWGAELEEYKSTINSRVAALKKSLVDPVVVDEIASLAPKFMGHDPERITPLEFQEVADFVELLTKMTEPDQSLMDLPNAPKRREILIDLIRREGGEPLAIVQTEDESPEKIFFDEWKLENQLFSLLRERSIEELLLMGQEEQSSVAIMDEIEMSLRKKHGEESAEVRGMEHELKTFKKILKTRNRYGEEWKNQLIKFQLTEKEIYAEWGKRMVANGYKSRFLQMGQDMGYF